MRKGTSRKGDFETFAAWRNRGLSWRAAAAATEAGCRTPDDVRKAGYLHFKSLHQCGRASLSELEVVAGGWTDGPRRVGPWIERTPIAKLIDELKRRGICTPDTAEE
jgi:hypothetical protein